jgi:FMN-dependent NADH-azoreductase
MNLLFIEASPRGEHSTSSRVANAFVEAYQKANPEHQVERLPLFDIELPSFSAEGSNQKMAQIVDMISGGSGIEASGEWAGVVSEIERLRSADKVIVSTPMWNFSIPYRLKHYFDLICQPGLSFYVNEQREYIGMITDKANPVHPLERQSHIRWAFRRNPTAPRQTSLAPILSTFLALSGSKIFDSSKSNPQACWHRTS